MTKLCITCQKESPHGYVNGTGEFLEHTCLRCYRRNMTKDNYIEGGDAKNRSKAPSLNKKEDR